MKIVEHTPDRLVIVHRPWIISGIVWLLGLAAFYGGITGKGTHGVAERLLVLALGIGMPALAWWFLGFLTLTFDRTAGQVRRSVHRITGTRHQTMPLTDVRRVRVDAQRSEDGHTERLVLETTNGPVPLELGFSGFGRDAHAAAINRWLAGEHA